MSLGGQRLRSTRTDIGGRRRSARREPTEAEHMLGEIGRWAFFVFIAFLALTGFLYLMRGTVVRHVRAVGADGSPVGPWESQFPLSVAMLTGASLLPENRVELALNGDGTYPRLWEDLRSATESITLQ